MEQEIFVDARQGASLRDQSSTVQFLNVERAISHWRQLSPHQQSHTLLALDSGQIYQPAEIELIRFDAPPAA
jgi:hypothetical protein